MAALNLASPDELNRVALVAVELFDPVSLSLVYQGISAATEGLAGLDDAVTPAPLPASVTAKGLPSRLAIRVAAASSSLIWLLQNTWPLPMRCCKGMRHCHPARCAVERV